MAAVRKFPFTFNKMAGTDESNGPKELLTGLEQS